MVHYLPSGRSGDHMCERGRTHVPPSYSKHCLHVGILILEIVEPGVTVIESICWSCVISHTKYLEPAINLL